MKILPQLKILHFLRGEIELSKPDKKANKKSHSEEWPDYFRENYSIKTRKKKV